MAKGAVALVEWVFRGLDATGHPVAPFASRHALVKWRRHPHVGVGPPDVASPCIAAALAYAHQQRANNPASLKQRLRSLDDLTKGDRPMGERIEGIVWQDESPNGGGLRRTEARPCRGERDSCQALSRGCWTRSRLDRSWRCPVGPRPRFLVSSCSGGDSRIGAGVGSTNGAGRDGQRLGHRVRVGGRRPATRIDGSVMSEGTTHESPADRLARARQGTRCRHL